MNKETQIDELKHKFATHFGEIEKASGCLPMSETEKIMIVIFLDWLLFNYTVSPKI